VVVLVDEYDKPILDNIENSELAIAVREGLRNIYSVIKDCDPHIKFAFLTGVSKFSKVSLFSGLNNLRDISLNPRYATLCGYTDKEIKRFLMGIWTASILRYWPSGITVTTFWKTCCFKPVT
jgi:hypothetical protein